MGKKVFIYSLLAAAIGLIGYVYYQFSKGESKAADVYDAVPSNVSLVWELKTGTALNEYQPWVKEISSNKNEAAGISFNPVSEWFGVIATLDSLRLVNDAWNKVLMQSNVVLASSPQLRGDTWMMSIGLPESESSATASTLMKAWINASSTRSFKNTTIHQSEKWQYAVVKNCLVMATSNSLMEDIIIRAEKNDLLIAQDFFKTARESRSTDVPLHFIFSMDSGQWLQLDPIASKGKITLSGYAVVNSASTSNFRLASKGNGFDVANHLPSTTTFLDAYSYKDFETGWNKQEEYYTGSEASKYWSRAWKDYGDTCACDLNDLLLSWRAAEWGTAIVPENDSISSEIMYIKAIDSTDVIAKMRPLIRMHESGIHQLLYPQLMDRNKPQSFLIECNYITQVGSMVLFAATWQDLNALKFNTERLSQLPSFQKTITNTSKEAGRLIYQSEFYTSSLPASLINIFKGSEFVAAAIEPFKESKYLVQLVVPASAISTASSTASVEAEDNEDLSESTSDENTKSWQVINHNDQSKETLTQNSKGELSLYDKSGKRLWKKNIEGSVLGEVSQVDALKNNKLQYAFTTDKALYIIDRNGNNLKGFPIKPKPPIQSPLHVADYDKDKKYRLLFTAGDGYLNNYGIDGKQTIGWKGSSNDVCFITDFKIGIEDYLLAIEKSAKLHLLKRTGEVKATTNAELTDYDGHKAIITPGGKLNETTITYTNKSGDVKSIELGN